MVHQQTNISSSSNRSWKVNCNSKPRQMVLFKKPTPSLSVKLPICWDFLWISSNKFMQGAGTDCLVADAAILKCMETVTAVDHFSKMEGYTFLQESAKLKYCPRRILQHNH